MYRIIIFLSLLNFLLSAETTPVEAKLTENDYKKLIEKLADQSSKVRKEAKDEAKKLNKTDLKKLVEMLSASDDPELTEFAKELKLEINSGEWQTTKSGLQYQILKKGAGEKKPQENSNVKVHYEGKLPGDTKNFDSSYERGEPASFPLNAVIKGWTEGLMLMSVGDKFIFKIPPDLAYGAQGAGTIPPNATLIFTIELLEIE